MIFKSIDYVDLTKTETTGASENCFMSFLIVCDYHFLPGLMLSLKVAAILTINIKFHGATAHWGPGLPTDWLTKMPTCNKTTVNYLWVSIEMTDDHNNDLSAISRFFDQNYHNKSIETQTP